METLEKLAGDRQNVRIIELAKLAIERLKNPEEIRKFHWEYMGLLRTQLGGKSRVYPEGLANAIIATCVMETSVAAMQLWGDAIPKLRQYYGTVNEKPEI